MVLNKKSSMRNIFDKVIVGKAILVMAFCLLVVNGFGQIVSDPATWTYKIQKVKDNKYEVHINLSLKHPYHIWSMEPGGDGLLLPPSFQFEKNKEVKLIGTVKEKGNKKSKVFIKDDPASNYFEDQVEYIQEVEVKNNTTIKGSHKFQVCDENACLSPKTKQFSLQINDIAATNIDTLKDTQSTEKNLPIAAVETNTDTLNKEGIIVPATPNPEISTQANTDNELESKIVEAKQSNFQLLWKGIGGGLASIITPCVFAMLPMTVSFFLKKSKDRKSGVSVASLYSLSIVFIFFLLGVILMLVNNGNILYEISTHWVTNVFFFIVFLIFSFSFLGAFELTLPASWSTFTDSKSNINSLSGIFFMALTLSIVSFSCTIPFLGWLIKQISLGERTGPLFGFTGYGIGMALPFTLFAIFPQLMQKLNKQGGWLNAVKVVFGFVELALAFKFLSNADLVKHWRLLDREIFIGIWAAIAIATSLYLFGVIRFSKDSELPKNDWGLPYLTVTRTVFAISSLLFAIYLIPGMWGAPLNGMGAFVPPMGTQDFVIGGGGFSGGNAEPENKKVEMYGDDLKIYEPEVARKNGLHTLFDYHEGLKASAEQHKPLFLDFTGITCVNCRKMETQVWSNPEVIKRMKENFIVVSLYCDAPMKVPDVDKIESKFLGKIIETLGDKNAHIQATKYNGNTQPYYFFIDDKENLLVPEGYAYDPDAAKFVKHLDKVIQKYKELHP